MSTILKLDENDVSSVLHYCDLIPLMQSTLISFSAGSTLQPVRQMLPVEPDQRYFGIMPAVLPTAMGAKLVSFYPKNAGSAFHTHLASIMLFDPDHGEPLAVMDGRLITEMRTAATSAAITRVLANRDSKKLALIGSGVQARAHLLALGELYDFDEICVWSRNADNAKSFALANGVQATSAFKAVENADIIVTATNALEPVLHGDWLKPGAHVNSVGSPRPTWRELDDDVMRLPLIVDSREAALSESGDVILSGAEVFAEAGEILSKEKTIDPGQTTVFKSVGIAVEDIATARWVYDRHIASKV